MEIKFSALNVYLNEDGDIVVRQPWMCEDDAIVIFPVHQAEQVCKAIMAVAAAKE
jgi:hypothetical protein